MFEKLGNFFNKMMKPEVKELTSKDAAKERLHLVLMQDRANVSVDFLELMKQEIIDVIKKYIVIDESSIDVRLTNKENEDGTNGAPSLYANIPILNIKNDVKAEKIKDGTLTYENGELEKAPEQEKAIELQPAPVSVEEKIEEVIEEIVEEVPEVKVQIKRVEDDDIEGLDDEDAEDVTFDDLLKKAEEEEKAVEPIVKFAAEEVNEEKIKETSTETSTIVIDNNEIEEQESVSVIESVEESKAEEIEIEENKEEITESDKISEIEETTIEVATNEVEEQKENDDIIQDDKNDAE